ncbi:MAG: hypothetical protein DSZ11_00305 [Sulfurovum sp.]|nr:MAG: hypothetical protein DSZ11_00305 [Sulfurovum sp.]
MALRGNSSQSFLRSKDLISFSEIFYDKDGNNIINNRVLEEALARDSSGNFIRHKSNIANILNRYGVIYRMVFNTMNMGQYTYDDVQDAVTHLSEYIHDLGISGIVEFHAADRTQNSDHIHFWISSEDTLIYNKIALEMVSMGYSNVEDVYIQKYEDNQKLDESLYVNSEDMSINERFSTKPILEIKEKEITHGILSSIREKYDLVVDNIAKLFKSVIKITKPIKSDSYTTKNCTLPKTKERDSILKRIEELKEAMNNK